MYESYYKLCAAPFQLMPDPMFLYPSQGHKRALSYLMYGMQRREGFVVITGDIGTGKTLLVQKMIDDVAGRNLSVVRVAMANLDADGVVPMVASAFGLSPESRSKVGLLNDLVAQILPRYKQGALLIVDEAQTCTPAALEELRAISNLQTRGRALLQVFLVGQSELRTTLAQPNMEQLRQRIITSHHLRPLELDELRNYVEYRLAAAGWHADPQLSEAIYPLVHAWSKGIPRRINLLMDRLFLYGYLEEQHALDESDLEIVVAELDAEQSDAIVALQPEAMTGGVALPDGEREALLGRIADLEKMFTAAVGETRAKQLLDKHETSVQQKALVEMNMRLARLESLLADEGALEALRQPNPPEHQATTPATSMPTVKSEPNAPTSNTAEAATGEQVQNEQATDTAAREPHLEHGKSTVVEQPWSDNQAAPQEYVESPAPMPVGGPKWRLFSRRD